MLMAVCREVVNRLGDDNPVREVAICREDGSWWKWVHSLPGPHNIQEGQGLGQEPGLSLVCHSPARRPWVGPSSTWLSTGHLWSEGSDHTSQSSSHSGLFRAQSALISTAFTSMLQRTQTNQSSSCSYSEGHLFV